MQPARPLLILLHIVTYRTDTQYAVKCPVPHTAPSAPHRTYNTSYPRAIPYETETRKNNLLNTPFPSQLGICRESYGYLLDNYLFESHEYLAIVVPRIPSASARLQPYAEPQNATAIPLPMLPLPHPRQCLREIDSEQTNTLFLVASHPTQRDGVNFVEVSGGINAFGDAMPRHPKPHTMRRSASRATRVCILTFSSSTILRREREDRIF
ncbi:hypothetical protein CNYM01_12884 [Colletotrichum nymphaeae SA-01]|uniref:Uncharacterized protein n=1 Tax=Colletotrichum nymphaeae SA-01 TaxID=1460502 RepID=A0A135SKS9_9PEZI|nr:hypothetical protein CNYM01_12884 [Colletotrichum nymphaeae SA-01]